MKVLTNFTKTEPMNKLLWLLALVTLVACNTPNSEVKADDADSIEAPPFQPELAGVFDQTIDKYVSLAEAIPADEYDWRPSEDVRSIKEAMMHVTGANYFFCTMVGGELPEGIDPRALEAEGKDEVLAHYKQATTLFKEAMLEMNGEDLSEKVEFFDGNDYSKQMVSMINLSHTSEHLGQLIAYARGVGVTPPWSEHDDE